MYNESMTDYRKFPADIAHEHQGRIVKKQNKKGKTLDTCYLPLIMTFQFLCVLFFIYRLSYYTDLIVFGRLSAQQRQPKIISKKNNNKSARNNE